MIYERAAVGRQPVDRAPKLWLPHVRPDHGLAAVEHRLPYRHHQRQGRHLVTYCHRRQQRLVFDDDRRSRDPNDLAALRHDKHQTNLRILDHVPEGVTSVVSRAIWHGKRLRIEHTDKAWRITLR